MKNDIFVLGTGLSHDGSVCLLKNGKIDVAIEKERITRVKHDGLNDTEAIQYCLKHAGIAVQDLALVVQNANFGSFEWGNDFFAGSRVFTQEVKVPVITISHHLAHAFSAIGTCPFDDFNVLVIDGCGSPYDDCCDLDGATIPDRGLIRPDLVHLYCEKDSYYRYETGICSVLYKDFSEMGYAAKAYPLHPGTTKHSIGGLYGAASTYCFRNVDDAGKLMGLAPYGRPGVFSGEIFELKDGRVFVNYDWMRSFRRPVRTHEEFRTNFQYYADLAYWVQKEVERAILYVVDARLELAPTPNLCFVGGVALNAVANAQILSRTKVKNLYLEPAAGDNGVAIGCAYYGWLEVLKKERVRHSGSTCFGAVYPGDEIARTIALFGKAPDIFFETLSEFSNLPPAGSNHGDFALIFRTEERSYRVIIRQSTLDHGGEEKPLFAGETEIQLSTSDLLRFIFNPEAGAEFLRRKGATNLNGDWRLIFEKLDSQKMLRRIDAQIKERIAFDGDLASKPSPDPDFIRKTAELLAEGRIVGWFQDGCEFGPRALGRRSILADPRRPAVRAFINSRIKFREDFRPFAPAVLCEDVSLYFQSDGESPYMILVDQVRPEWRDKIRSVVHEDGSCRIQTVTADWNPKFYRLLQEFKAITGISVLLNTSFNRRGMPIVETPYDALRFFHSCDLDCLTIGEYIVEKNRATASHPVGRESRSSPR